MANWWEMTPQQLAAQSPTPIISFVPGMSSPEYQKLFDQGYTLSQRDPWSTWDDNAPVGNFQTDPSNDWLDPVTGRLFYKPGGAWESKYDSGGLGAYDLGMIIAALGTAGALAYGGAGAAAAGGAETGAGAVGADAGLGVAGGAGAGGAGAVPAWAPAQAGTMFSTSMPWQAMLMEAQTAAGAGLTAQEMLSLGMSPWAAYAGSLPLPQIKGPSSLPSGGLSNLGNLSKLGNIPWLGGSGGGEMPSINRPSNAIPSSTHNFQLWNPAQQVPMVNPQLGQTTPVQSWANMLYGRRPTPQLMPQPNFAAMFQPQTGVMK